MIISYKHRYIFIKSRKTASSSIHGTLLNHCGEHDVHKNSDNWNKDRKRFDTILKHHIPYRIWLKLSGNYGWHSGKHRHPQAWLLKKFAGESWDAFFKFTFIRNPWDLTVSRFHWDRFKKRHDIDDFNLWLKKRKNWHWDILNQYTHINGRQAVDFIGRFENLEKDFEYVCSRIGLGKIELGQKNMIRKKTKHYTEYYNKKARETVAEIFKKDIRYFGYKFGEN